MGSWSWSTKRFGILRSEKLISLVESFFFDLTRMRRISTIFILLLGVLVSCEADKEQTKPNILFIFIDDMGYGDLGCYGNEDVHTPNIDQLASEGLRIDQFYVNAPICSPSRVAVTTGQYPSRWGISSYIDDSKRNEDRGMKNFLSLEAPSVARVLQQNGYYTAHIGKWHMGGGRDVDYAPMISEYGFDESVTQFEGLGERYLATFETLPNLEDSTRSLEKWSASLGKGEIHWAKREDFTQIFVERTMQAIARAKKAQKPFYINLWPDDIHTPLEPPAALRGDLSVKARFLGVVQEMDSHMGRLFDYIKSDPELSENTLIVFTSDNGPDKNVNKAGKIRGYKTNLYEGGIREPFIAWWPGKIAIDKVGTVDRSSVMAGIDLPLTFLEVAGIRPEVNVDYDGEGMMEVLKGNSSSSRSRSVKWLRPPDRSGYDGDNDPDLAIRKGEYKLLMDVDGNNVQLYDVVSDPGETTNLAETKNGQADALIRELMDWYLKYPHDIDRGIFENNLK